MRKQMIENAVYDVATQVRAVEDSIEAALIEIAELQTRMVRARGITKAGILTSHAAFEELAATTNKLVDARGRIASCHVALAETRQTIPGARTVMIGDTECPPASGHANLRVVA